jgi:acyl-coenzyme A thioesterase PaaI-like protein
VRSDFTLADDFEGLGGVAHGGIIATVLDEAMAWCLYRNLRAVFVTASMEQRFRDRVPIAAPLAVEAWIEEEAGRSRVRVAARVFRPDEPGESLAEGKALYVRAPGKIMDDLPEEQRRQLEALFAGFEISDATSGG